MGSRNQTSVKGENMGKHGPQKILGVLLTLHLHFALESNSVEVEFFHLTRLPGFLV